VIIARQSTARTVIVGPVLDADGVAVTGGVVADFKISKNGAAPAALNGSATLTHRHTGHYSLALTASDLDTVGQAEVVIDDTVNACAPKELTVIEESVYDILYAASASGAVPVSSGGITTASFAAGAINAAAIADAAIDAATFAASAITSTVLADDAITAAKVASNVTTELQSGLATAASISALNNLSSAQVATEIADALGTDTYVEPTGVPAATASLAAKIGRLYMALRNGLEVTEDNKTFLDDSGAAEWKKALADDGTTYSEGEAEAP
jgi:hypothetical protein